MSNTQRSDIIDQLVGSYLTVPVAIFWETAKGIPFPDTFERARVEFTGIATAWLNLQKIICHAAEVHFIAGPPAKIQLQSPSIEIVVGQAELDRWVARFKLPYRLELAAQGLVVHTEIAGFPVGEFETRLEVVDGWFVLQPKRASILGVPSYVSDLFRSYLPLPPVSSEARLANIEHAPGALHLTFALDDFTEEVTPGLLTRLRKRFFPMAEQISSVLPGPS